MQRLTTADILDKQTYEQARADLRRRIMVQKEKRRVAVGDHVMFHFENRDTMHYQVHEMLRTEESWLRAGAVDDEIEAYNPIIPRTGELSATMMIEYATAPERALMLPRFVGIERHVWLRVGDSALVPATFDGGQIAEHKVSSVQYVKFALSEEQRRLLKADGTVVRLTIDHPAYTAQAVLSEETRKAIASDPD
jgi:hypothetical protein